MKILYIAEANLKSSTPGSNRNLKFIEYFNSKVQELRHLDPVKHKVTNVNEIKEQKGRSFFLQAKERLKEKLNSRVINLATFSLQSIKCIFKILIWRLKGFIPDVIYISYKPISVFLIGSFAKLIFRSRLIVEYRDLASIFSDCKRFIIIKKLDFLIEKIFLMWVENVVVVSPTQAKKFHKYFGIEALVILNGIDSVNNYIPSNQIKKFKQSSVVIYAGMLSSRRNLNPFSKVIKKKDIRLKVFSKQNPFNYLCCHSLSDRISFEGFKTRSQLFDAYSKADAFLLLEGYNQSSHENIPSKVFEYMFFHKPIYFCGDINSDVGKILMDTGLLIHVSETGEFLEFLDQKKLKANFGKYWRYHQFKRLKKLIIHGL